MTHAKKKVKKAHSVIRTDANERIRERNARVKKQREWQEKKMQELQEKYEKARNERLMAEAAKKQDEPLKPLDLTGAFKLDNEEDK